MTLVSNLKPSKLRGVVDMRAAWGQELAAESGPDGVWWTASARGMELFGDHPFNTRGDGGEAAPSGDYAAGLAALTAGLDLGAGARVLAILSEGPEDG